MIKIGQKVYQTREELLNSLNNCVGQTAKDCQISRQRLNVKLKHIGVKRIWV